MGRLCVRKTAITIALLSATVYVLFVVSFNRFEHVTAAPLACKTFSTSVGAHVRNFLRDDREFGTHLVRVCDIEFKVGESLFFLFGRLMPVRRSPYGVSR